MPEMLIFSCGPAIRLIKNALVSEMFVYISMKLALFLVTFDRFLSHAAVLLVILSFFSWRQLLLLIHMFLPAMLTFIMAGRPFSADVYYVVKIV